MKYAIIQDGKIVNLAEAEPDFAAAQGWIEYPDYDANDQAISIGWSYDGTTFTPPTEEAPSEEA